MSNSSYLKTTIALASTAIVAVAANTAVAAETTDNATQKNISVTAKKAQAANVLNSLGSVTRMMSVPECNKPR